MPGSTGVPAIQRVDASRYGFGVDRKLSVSLKVRRPGPPVRMDGLDIGIVDMTEDAPHGGEVHPDGDEILYVISGRLRVSGDSAPDQPVLLGPGDACVVRRGEWHRVEVLEPTRLVHVTPGPNGDHRPREAP